VVPAGATPLFADVDAEQQAWFERHRVRPINHMVVVSTELSNTRPDAVKQVFELLQQSAAQAAGDAPSFTSEEITRSLALISQYAAQQQLIPRPFAVDELFDDVTRSLR
jgi:4,5-dihydroxyphthalate decarboxylase